MTESPFNDTSQPPTPEEVRSALGSRFELWERLTGFVERTYHAKGTWSTWGPAKTGWNLRYRLNGRSVTALHPQKERILVQVVLGLVQAERALKLELGEEIARMLRESPQLRDGRWLFIPVIGTSNAEDVEKLLLAKLRPLKATT